MTFIFRPELVRQGWLTEEWSPARVGYVVATAECARTWREHIDALEGVAAALKRMSTAVRRGLRAAGYVRD